MSTPKTSTNLSRLLEQKTEELHLSAQFKSLREALDVDSARGQDVEESPVIAKGSIQWGTVRAGGRGYSAGLRCSKQNLICSALATGDTQRGESNRVLAAIPSSSLFAEPANYYGLCRWLKA